MVEHQSARDALALGAWFFGQQAERLFQIGFRQRPLLVALIGDAATVKQIPGCLVVAIRQGNCLA